MREFALLLKFAFLLLSVLLVFFSPRCFSYEFCACILFLYLIENLLYFTCYKEDVVSFHGVFFFLSFLLILYIQSFIMWIILMCLFFDLNLMSLLYHMLPR